MSNNLTGSYDAVLLIRVAKINAILATLHQNGADEDASPTFPHSARTRLGDPPKIVRPPFGEMAGWFNKELASANRSGPRNGMPWDTAPPGAAKLLGKAFADLQAVRVDVISPPTGPTIRGTVWVQMSPPALSLPGGSTSEVTVSVYVRAKYIPDPGTLALPEFVHGEVRVTYSAAVKTLLHYHSVTKILDVDVPQDDAKIEFHLAPGVTLPSSDLAQLLAQIRKLVREGFEPVNTQLPNDFPFRRFKELGGGQVLALPISLESAEPPEQALQTVNYNFLSDDFSIGVGKEFVQRQLQPTIDRLKQFRQSFSISIDFGPFSAGLTTYYISVTSVELEWSTGTLDLVIKVNATADYAPDYDVTIRQHLTLGLHASSQHISLRASGDPDISVSGTGGGFLEGRIRPKVISERDAALPQAEDLINDNLTGDDGVIAKINAGLKAIDPSIGVRFSAVRVTPDGLILDGLISTSARNSPAVSFEETRDGTAFTAFDSWIPGGHIQRFDWSWVMHDPISIWGGHVVSRSENHTFILPKPPADPGPVGNVLGDVCLRISGVRINPSGNQMPISAGRTCSISTPEVAWRMPSWVGPLVTPVFFPDLAPDAILENSISAHVSLLTDRPSITGQTANAVVHFADKRMDQPLASLGKALSGTRRKNAPVLMIVVLPPETLKGRRRDVEAQLGSIGEKFVGRLLVTEDYAGGWSRTFDAGKLPATYLLNGEGKFVWKQEGSLDAASLAKAIDEHFTAARAPHLRRLSLALRPCNRRPDALLTDDRGQRLALRKLRGHRVLLNFWQSWSDPCLRELQRLQSLHEKGLPGAPVIVAINGGEKPEVLAEVRRKLKLTFALVLDPERTVARQFGIECWPTTVSLHGDRRVDGVLFGAIHEHETAVQNDTVNQTQTQAS